MAIVFLDTEFTDLLSPALLSMGMVSGDGAEFYAELDLQGDVGKQRVQSASAFVKLGGVLDQWGRIPDAAGTEWEMGRRAAEWLLELSKTCKLPIEIAFDYPMDFELLEYAIRDAGLWESVREDILPINIGNLTGSPDGEMAAEDCYRELSIRGGRGIGRHHALADALALRAAYLAVKQIAIGRARQEDVNQSQGDLDTASDTESEFLAARDNMSDAELAERVRSAPDMGASMLVELSEFAAQSGYRYNDHNKENLHAEGYKWSGLENPASSGFGQDGHYALVVAEGPVLEHDLVELTATSESGRPAGAVGVVVHVYPDAEAFEVEFNTEAGYTVETILNKGCRKVLLVHVLLKRWVKSLAPRVGRSEKAILEDGLLAQDFPGTGVRIVFEDGSDLVFQNAFYLGDVETRIVDKTICQVAVFTEHVGDHEFWVGPEDRVLVVDLLFRKEPIWQAQAKTNAQSARLRQKLTSFRPENHGGEFPSATVSHEAETIQELKDNPQEALFYLSAVLADGSDEEILIALRRVCAAMGVGI